MHTSPLQTRPRHTARHTSCQEAGDHDAHTGPTKASNTRNTSTRHKHQAACTNCTQARTPTASISEAREGYTVCSTATMLRLARPHGYCTHRLHFTVVYWEQTYIAHRCMCALGTTRTEQGNCQSATGMLSWCSAISICRLSRNEG